MTTASTAKKRAPLSLAQLRTPTTVYRTATSHVFTHVWKNRPWYGVTFHALKVDTRTFWCYVILGDAAILGDRGRIDGGGRKCEACDREQRAAGDRSPTGIQGMWLIGSKET